MVGSRKSSTASISTSRPASTRASISGNWWRCAIASARAAPRASSRSRHSFPVAECDTPRNASGISTGNADAGSVMMLSADSETAADSMIRARQSRLIPVIPGVTAWPLSPGDGFAVIAEGAGPFGASRRMTAGYSAPPSTPHPVGDPVKILGDDIPIAGRLEIVLLQRAVFGRTRDEGGFQAQFLGGFQVVVMGGDHHHLLGRQAQQARGAEIGFGVGLVVFEQFRRQDQVPG